MIHHLSHPAGSSVNDYIPREYTSVQYGSVDDAVRLICQFPDPYLAKTDIRHAFRIIPIRPEEWPLLGFHWRGAAYVDLALPMGCASSSQTFQLFSDALVWISQNKFSVGPVVSVLDDFLFIGATKTECQQSLDGFRRMCDALCVPLRPDKTVEPCRSLQFLGVMLDIDRRELRLPLDKVQRARAEVARIMARRKAPLRQVQSCIGLLNFACLAVPLGRPFLRRMYDLCRGVSRPHHRVRITRTARLDLSAWKILLASFNGRSMLEECRWEREPGLLVETDAAGGVGIGAIVGSEWLIGPWPEQLRDADISVKELVAVVVAVSVWKAKFQDRCVMVRCDNSGVVACITSQSSRSPDIMHWLRQLFVTTALNNIYLRAVHTPGSRNGAADALSRGMVQSFRRMRPAADSEPTPWSWRDFRVRPR